MIIIDDDISKVNWDVIENFWEILPNTTIISTEYKDPGLFEKIWEEFNELQRNEITSIC